MSRKSYDAYLNSPVWKRLRKAALDRDGNMCRSCGSKADHVHHAHYPRVLGKEKPEWLFSVCVACHEEIHKLVASGLSLKDATHTVIAGDYFIPEKKTRRPRKQRKPRGPRRAKAPKGEATMEQILGLKLHLEKRR